MAKDTMRAVVFKGPRKVALEERPIPKIQDPMDIIVKVMYTALCGRYSLRSKLIRHEFADCLFCKRAPCVQSK